MIFNYAENRLEIWPMSDLIVSSKQIITFHALSGLSLYTILFQVYPLHIIFVFISPFLLLIVLTSLALFFLYAEQQEQIL